MKKKIGLLVIVLTLGIVSTVNAQIKFGAKVGLNMSSASVLDFGNLSNNLNAANYNGLMVGPTMEVSLFGMGFDASLLYSQKGIAIKDFGNASISYLELPINLKYKLGIPKVIGVYGTAGPYFSYAFSDKLSSDVIKSIDKSSVEVGVSVGAGVELLSKIQVGAVYSIGLNKNTVEIADPMNAAAALTKMDYRNGTLSLTATYFF
ncbi:MAG: porin family protein [Bacteroidales bacterium]|nr:porin family protein [Bacteroidales bacterium]